ncbi:hypothetical protein BOTNAR_0094g00310 [Botryotinia narcissicola]|uniref:Uncharacterized protein n=1 Tax=Botryotinia narcissicola TaxID=278944 RepID=A0A4Z1ITG3_9HELO|nr:hypothetical protein BOTNAR_0094g00310 [Botryotinia narcissicola]
MIWAGESQNKNEIISITLKEIQFHSIHSPDERGNQSHTLNDLDLNLTWTLILEGFRPEKGQYRVMDEVGKDRMGQDAE